VEKLNRRKFIGSAIGLAGLAGSIGCGMSDTTEAAAPLGPPPGAPPPPFKPTDSVKLGKSGLAVSLVGLGTGSVGWGKASNQTRLGQPEFTRMMRHGLDNGIVLYDLADQYGSNPFFRRAMEGVPRDRYVIQTKTNSRTAEGARADIDRFLTELGTDHIDSLIIHCVTEADWTTRYRGVMDVFEEAKAKGKIRAHGVTCHSFEALKAAEASDWVQINQVRWNPGRAHMDSDVESAGALFKKMRAKGQGMIGMKVVGQGDLVGKLTPEECFRFQVESGVVDAFVVGVEKVAHIDELLQGTQRALNSIKR
jgi:aryl-alcohol dehydrogenase-like predicted oxidoreductase